MESKRGCYSLSLSLFSLSSSLSLAHSLPLLFLGTSRATTSRRDREGWVVVVVVVGCVWIGRASINQAEPEGFRGGRDGGEESGKRQGGERERERERERDDGAGGDGGTAGGLEKKRECGWRGGEGETRRGAQRLQEWWGERWTVG